MSQDSLEALHLLLERATQERDRLAGELRRTEGLTQRARQQAEQLAGYRTEYRQRWSTQFGQGSAVEIVHCYHSFMQRLDEAMAQQQQQVEAAARQEATLRQALMHAELRAASVRKLIERRQAEQRHRQARREQRQTDETAQLLTQRRSPNSAALPH